MKSVSVIVSLLATAAFATPSIRRDTPIIAFSVNNDVIGASVSATALSNGKPLHFRDAFANTALEKDGKIIATSAQLNTIIPKLACVIGISKGPNVGFMDAATPFLDLDGVSGAAVETDVSDLVIVCQIGQA
jgi:hypothetical protein